MKGALLSLSLVISASLFAQQDEIYVVDKAAVNGYDVVAYFKENKPVKGNAMFAVTYKGATWFFANKENAELFKAAPGDYEPEYGGYCAFGCSGGYKAKTSPDAWSIVNGKLYLNYDTGVREKWNSNREAYIKKADANWINIKHKKYN